METLALDTAVQEVACALPPKRPRQPLDDVTGKVIVTLMG
jgi:hypothetical protein